ncbi:unnamed protein product [Aspergillus oryzae var. brunneus]|uniref:Unnamed protein product n=2 Tax=Aspergillus oryzae TaxID=5062 RepID=A0AAN4YAC0_ASPOZ|nr:unnamed protein product [Aspergillus oryzae]GMG26111.1 unnamed protein product [Aspergillus oryzae]GMG49378.1 unnamed protein product [Aspergillus oryzae var. brunneus]
MATRATYQESAHPPTQESSQKKLTRDIRDNSTPSVTVTSRAGRYPSTTSKDSNTRPCLSISNVTLLSSSNFTSTAATFTNEILKFPKPNLGAPVAKVLNPVILEPP